MRTNLLDEERFSRYLLYAIGEMVLVILGILIALQINNWNEERKETRLSEEMVAEIKAGLEGDLKQLNQMMYFQETVLASQNALIGWLASDTPWVDTMAAHLSRTYMKMDYAVNYSGYETLKQIGLRSIKNDSVRLAIANLYEVEYPSFIKYTTFYQKFLEGILTNNPWLFNELNYMRATMRPLDVPTLKNSTRYAYNLRTLRNVNELLILQGEFLRDAITATDDCIALPTE